MKKIIFFIFVLFSTTDIIYAESIHFVDFKFLLNESNAGKKAQNELKSKLDNGLKSLKSDEKKIQEEEKKIIQQKKLIPPEEYKNKVTALRKKVSALQKKRSNLLDDISKKRSLARNELLKNLNPILKDYMNEKKIRVVLDKKSILLADENLNITNDILKTLNQKLKSINIK